MPTRRSQPLLQLQRSGLTASQDRIIVAYTGFDDCGAYHGYVVGIPEAGGKMRTFETDTAKGETEGGVWMGGAAPVVDPAGDIWFTVANGSVTGPSHRYDGSNSSSSCRLDSGSGSGSATPCGEPTTSWTSISAPPTRHS